MAVNKVVMNTAEGEETLIDLTRDSVTPETLAEGETAHNAAGEEITGVAPLITVTQELGDSTTKVMSQKAVTDKLASMGQLKPEFAESLEWLEENGDQSKMYVLIDKDDPNYGFIFEYKMTEKEIESGPSYTNILETYKPAINTRWSFSGKKPSASDGYMLIGPLPVKPEDVVRINEVFYRGYKFFTSNYCRIHYLDASGNHVSGTIDRAPHRDEKLTVEENATSWVVGYVNATDNDPSTNTKITGYDNITQMVVVFDAAKGTGTAITEADVAGYIMTINEEIEEGGGTEIVTEYAWVNTGFAFVPADYEGRIIAVENKASSNTTRIIDLENKVANGLSDVLTDAEKLKRIREWDKPIFDYAPVTLLTDDRVKPALTTADRTIAAIYAKYRALMAANPRYITETNLGPSSSSDTFAAVDMLRFDFKEPDGLTSAAYNPASLHETKPKIIFMSGVHTEWVGVWGLYYALEEITTNPEFDDIRRNAHIIVVPCANPCCLAWETAIDGWRMSHVNANGVAIHNNFNVDHSTSGTVGEYNYGGTAPCSELETQYIDKIMADNPDAVAFVSCHNNDYSTEFGTPVIWASSATYHMCNVTFRLIDKLSKAWVAKYGNSLTSAIDTIRADFPALQEGDYRLGRASMSTSKGTEQKNATKYGIQGVNVEIARMMKVFSGNTDGTSEVMTHGAEVYANFMRTLLTVYNHTDKQQYYT